MSIKKWKVGASDDIAAKQISEELGISGFLSRLITARGAKTPEEAKKMFFEQARISDPLQLIDMQKAVDAIRAAVAAGEKICIFGDYDCDGVTATVILQSYLENLGADVTHYIPDRANGYGMNKSAVKSLFEDGIDLIITVDNGISAIDEAEFVYELGMKLVVTDHHQAGDVLPRAEAVVDLHRADSRSEFKEFCGAGIAFLLVCAMEDGDIDFVFEQYGDLAAIATVGDIVSLKSENKAIVSKGLELLPNTERPGLIKLIERSGIKGEINSSDIAFRLVPRINAAGRFSNAELAAELLLSEDEDEADELARILCETNDRRKETEAEISEKIDAQIRENPDILNSRVLVFAGEGWHQGVLGIVSARLLEIYQKPVIVLTVDGSEAHGSARSVDGFSIYTALCDCKDSLERFGGHHKAAGLTVKTDKIGEFTERINSYARDNFETMPIGASCADMVIRADEITVENIRELKYLEPFGEGNKRPNFEIQNAVITAVRPIKGGKFTQIKFDYEGKSGFFAVSFKIPAEKFPFAEGESVEMLVTLDISAYTKNASPSIVINDIRPSGFAQDRYFNAKAVYEGIRLGEGFDKRLASRIIPEREQIGAIYKFLQGRTLSLDTLCFKLWKTKISYCMMMLAIDILCELGLCTCDAVNQTVTALKAERRVSLESSQILSSLKG